MTRGDGKSSSRLGQLLRWLLAAAVIIAVGFGLRTLLGVADASVDLWLRMQQLPLWLSAAFAALAIVLVLASGWLLWRILRPQRARAPLVAPTDRPAIERRLAELESAPPSLSSELLELDRRQQSADVFVALFGEISSGKSSLVRALAPDSLAAVGAAGGTTRQVSLATGKLPDGRTLQVADVPGFNDSDDSHREQLARDEAARAHALVFVVDGDLTRRQDDELQPLLASGRPVVIALNKSDRYSDDERDAVLARLQQRYRGKRSDVDVVAVSAGHSREVLLELSDGEQRREERAMAPEISALQAVLSRITARGSQALEAPREAATLGRLDARIGEVEVADRRTRADDCVQRYTRRAVVGAMAAVAPGTDLLIQGALATMMIRELCSIHALPAREIDLDSLVARAGGAARNSTAVTLAIAGNALKAFPGAGTLSGGLVHALAYGLIFDALGRAVTQTLADHRALDRETALRAFSTELGRPSADRLRALASMAWQARREFRRPAADKPSQSN